MKERFVTHRRQLILEKRPRRAFNSVFIEIFILQKLSNIFVEVVNDPNFFTPHYSRIIIVPSIPIAGVRRRRRRRPRRHPR
jgi:hypothetical protein